MRYLTFKKVFYVIFVLFISLFFVSNTSAAAPTLSVSNTSDGDTMQIYVTGDPSSSVLFFYIKNGAGQQISSLGSTNTSGSLTTNISASSYNVSPNTNVYVKVGGLNGAQSPNVPWPTVSGVSSSGMVSLSQTGLVLSVGQSSTLTASNLSSSSLYLSSNTNPKIANVNISGNQVAVLANSYGSTVATLCLLSNSSNCASVYITVQNTNTSPLTFSQNSVSIYSGQTLSIQISGGSGSYYVSNNSSQNQGIVSTSISGSNISLSTASTTGSSSITVCSTDNTSCGIINVSIGSGSASLVSFSQSNPTVTVGQSINISIYGPTSSVFYVSSNSNPSIVQPNLSGATLTLLGITNGTSNIIVCASSSNCGTLAVTVNNNTGVVNNAHPILSQDSITLSVGQTRSISISGGSMPYSISSLANSLYQSSLNSNTLTITGLSAGSQGMNVCSFSGNCSTLSVVVTGGSNVTTPIIPPGCLSSTQFSPITGQYCSNYVYVPLTTNTSTVDSTPAASLSFKFTKALKLGSKGDEVKELQKKLKELGYYKGKIDGGYGSILEKAVRAYQKAHKLEQRGNVGPGTRASLNKE